MPMRRKEEVNVVGREAPDASWPLGEEPASISAPQRPEFCSESEGTMTLACPPSEYSTLRVPLLPTTNCLHDKILQCDVSIFDNSHIEITLTQSS